MPIFLELPVFTSFNSLSRASLCSHSSKRVFHGNLQKLGLRLNIRTAAKQFLGIRISSEKDYLSDGFEVGDEREVNGADIWGDSEFVEVIGIGSRMDGVLDFCLGSPFKSSSLRDILTKDSMKVQLQQRFTGKDLTPRIVGALISIQPGPKAIILVASAGYSLDHTAAVDILRATKSAQGFTVVIILKTFSFEGQRRQDELREHTNLFIDIDTDMLLRKDLVTLDEAVKTSNNAVLLAINAISVLLSETHRKLIDVSHDDVQEVQVSELIKILESHNEAKVGFGAGYNAKTSILKALYDCLFLGIDVKELNGIVLCILASSNTLDLSDVYDFLLAF